MWLQQIFVACLILQHVAAVVNTGQTKNVEESVKTSSESKDNEKAVTNIIEDLVAESSEKANRREASTISRVYGAPSIPNGHLNLPVPIYGVPHAPSNNVIYPAPPPDIAPPKSLPSSLYGIPSFGKTYGVPQINPLPPISKGPGLSQKYGLPSFSFNQFSTNLVPPKSIYGPPKTSYGPPGKPLNYQKYPSKGFGIRPPKHTYGTPGNFKDNFNYDKFNFNNNKFNSNNFNTNNFNGLYTNSLSANNAFSSLYSGISSLNHQYGAPILPPKQTISPQYGTPNAILSTLYDVPGKTIVESPVVGYGPPQPSSNPRPPHPGAPAPPTPPDIKYDGWQPIPGLVSKRPVADVHHVTGQGSGYHNTASINIGNNQLSNSYGAPPNNQLGNLYGAPSNNQLGDSYGAPPNNQLGDSYGAPPNNQLSESYGAPPNNQLSNSYGAPPNNQLSDSYGAPPVQLDISHGDSLLYPTGPSNSYGVPLNSVTGSQTGVSDSYSAPLGTVTGSGGIVASSGAEAHGGLLSESQQNSHSNSHSISLDLSSIVGHGSDIHAVKSIEYDISPHGASDSYTGSSIKISDSYIAPQLNSISLGGGYDSKYSHNSGSFAQDSRNSFSSHGHKSHFPFSSTKGLVPPSGVYGAPASNQYGNSLYSYEHSRHPKRPVIHREPIPHGVFQNNVQESYNKDIQGIGSSSSSIYIPPPPPPAPPSKVGISTSYGGSSGTGAISFQNVVHGSSTAGINLHENSLSIEGANSLPLTSYNISLEPTDESYKLASSGNDIHVALDYSHPSQTIDLTQVNHASNSNDCLVNNQQYPPLAYDVPLAESYASSLSGLTTNIATSQSHGVSDLVAPQPQDSAASHQYIQDLTHSSSIKSEAKVNSIEVSEETHGKNYGKSVAESFGPNSELVESHSIDLNNIPLQGTLGSYTLQIQSADGAGGQIPHTQVLNDGLLQSILQAIEQPGQQDQNNKYPIILQPSIERNNYLVNETVNNVSESQSQGSEIREVIVEAPKTNGVKDEVNSLDDEETLQLLDSGNIALYYKKDSNVKKDEIDDKGATDNEETASVKVVG